jgi:N-acetylmuramoyl-L-alanine amidase
LWPDKPDVEPWMMHGAAPGDGGVTVERLQRALAQIGYRIEISGTYDEQTEAVVRAFQRRWRPTRVSGQGDSETVALAAAVAALAQPAIA